MPERYHIPGWSRIVTEHLTAASVAMIEQIASYSMKGIARQMAEANIRLNRQQQAFADAVRLDAIPAAIRQQMHYEVGSAAQRSVVAAYTHRRNRRGSTPYRTAAKDPRNQRYAGGMLLRALQASDFFEATPSVLRWGNITRLNQEASQWKRLNFGAGSSAGDVPGRFPMVWGDFISEAIGLTPDPQRAFRIPTGYWFQSGPGARISGGAREAGAEFYPVGEQPPGRWGRPNRARMTAGIAASNFMDAGVRRIAEEYPRAASAMMARVYRNRPLAERIKVRTNVNIPMPSGVQRFGRFRR
jgi:hypothetical protein